MYDAELKKDIFNKAKELGAELVGCCSADIYDEEPMTDKEYRPKNIWPWAKTVITVAIPIFYPISATAPSILYRDLYDTTNRVMDNMCYNLAKYIVCEKKQRAIYFPRDVYAGKDALLTKPESAFSHVIAGYYAGLGTIGDNHTLLSKEFGPRMRLVSVITDAELEPDKKYEKNICLHCGNCLRRCPSASFEEGGDKGFNYDKLKCTKYQNSQCGPCGYCITFCPVGEDLKMYRDVEGVTKEGVEHIQSY